MSEEIELRQRRRRRIWLTLAALAAILAVLIVPPFLSVSRYKARITQLISASLGRPVRLSSVEVRLLPRPGFVLTDLTVEEDPAYGAEPVLHANTVTASIRLLSLWRGRVEIDAISVDEASLNVVRTASGRWNLDSLLRTATGQAQFAAGGTQGAQRPVTLPYLKATNSRINIKSGEEKLPFSLLDAEISLGQQAPGAWRVRLRGRPARTDLTLEEADTGMVRMEADLRQAQQLRQMPLHVDLEWREAQLGQLTRLLLGNDAGWRGDLTGEMRIDGTAEAAQIKSRLRATGVHRAEFAPAAPMDFDANCALVAHFSTRELENLVCDSPLGNGHIRLTGNLAAGLPRFSVELQRIPVAAGLDALRTVRSGAAPGMEAAGTVSGKISYTPTAASAATPETSAHPSKLRTSKIHPAVEDPLAGSLLVEGLQISGNGLSEPIRISKLVLQPAPTPVSQPSGAARELAATVAIPAGGALPLTVTARLALSGYQLAVHGQASIARGRELARVAGVAETAALDALSGDPITVDLTAQGPWMAEPNPPIGGGVSASGLRSLVGPADSIAGVVTLHNASWKADYLANRVEISSATLHLSAEEADLSPVLFSYGPVKGTAVLLLPIYCGAQQPCQPRFQLQFGALDAGLLQAAFLGARQKGTMLSTLLRGLRPTAAPAWPQMTGTVKAESLLLGPITLHAPAVTLNTLPNGAEMTEIEAGVLGGRVHGSGKFQAAASATEKPSYEFEGQFTKLSPQAVGQLLGVRSTGGGIDGGGKIELSGYTGSDLAASAKGALHFEWQRGSMAAASGAIPPPLLRFDRWSADAEIANGVVTLKESTVQRGPATEPVSATITLADSPKTTFAAPKAAPAK